MSYSEIDITSLIIVICVAIPALISISICVVVYFSQRTTDSKLRRPTIRVPLHNCEPIQERPRHNNYMVDFTNINRSQERRRPREPPPVFEQSPPSYDMSVNQMRQQAAPLFLLTHPIPTSASTHSSSSIITPSVHSLMPPSYAEIFLKPQSLPNG